MISSTESLVKYANPLFVGNNLDRKSQKGPPSKPKSATNEAPMQYEEEILSSILPPREWMEGNQLCVQQVSSIPSTRADVLHLEEQLDKKLQQRQARQAGICPVRREIYSQLFDELIRQVTINCAERGLLLLRVRDEIQMTLAAYQTLYESSVPFGFRKVMVDLQTKEALEKKIRDLQGEIQVLLQQVETEKDKFTAAEKREVERNQLDEKKHAAEIDNLKRINEQLQAQLKGVLTPKK